MPSVFKKYAEQLRSEANKKIHYYVEGDQVTAHVDINAQYGTYGSVTKQLGETEAEAKLRALEHAIIHMLRGCNITSRR